MSRIENILSSLAEFGNRANSVVPEDHRCYRYYSFFKVMLNNVNREIANGKEI